MKCRKCGSKNMGVMPNKKNPSATDLYCCDCGAWQKFATKDEIRLYSAPKRIFTNADRIRAMSDEELAEFLCHFRSDDAAEHACSGCKAEPYCRSGRNGMIDWLQQLAEEDT